MSNNGYHIDFKMMMEGIEVPFRSAVISNTPNGIEMNIDVHSNSIVFELKPKTSIQIFYKDWIGSESEKKWRLMCDAYFSAYGKNDTSMQGGNRSLTLMCRDFRMDIRKTPSTLIYAPDDMDLGGTQRKFASVNGLSFTKANNADIATYSFGAADSLKNFPEIIKIITQVATGNAVNLATGAANGRYILEAFSRGVWMSSVSLAPYSASIASRTRVEKKLVIPKNDAGFSFLSEQYMGQLIKGIVYGNSMFSSVEAVMMRVAAIFQAFPYSCSTPNIININKDDESDLFISKEVKEKINTNPGFGYRALLNSCMILPPLNFTAPPNCNIVFPSMSTSISWIRDIDADPTRGHFDVSRVFDDMTDESARRAWAISREIPAANIDFYKNSIAAYNAGVKDEYKIPSPEERDALDSATYKTIKENSNKAAKENAEGRQEAVNRRLGIKTEEKEKKSTAKATKVTKTAKATPAAASTTGNTQPPATGSAQSDKKVEAVKEKPKEKPKGVAGNIFGVKAFLSMEERYSGVNVMYGSLEMYSMGHGQSAFIKDKFIDGTTGADNLAKILTNEKVNAKLSAATANSAISEAEAQDIISTYNKEVQDNNKNPTISDMAYRHALIKYMNGRTSSRSVSVQMDFNPYIVSGFPAIVLVPKIIEGDAASSSMKHLYGIVQSVRHTIAASGEATTSVSMTAVRFLDEPSKINENGDYMYCEATDPKEAEVDPGTLRYKNQNYSVANKKQKALYEITEPKDSKSVFAYDIKNNEFETEYFAADLLMNDGDSKANYSYMDVDYTPFRIGKFYEGMFGQKAKTHFMVGERDDILFMYDTVHEAAAKNLISNTQLMNDYESAIRYVRRGVVDEFNFYVKIMGASYRIDTTEYGTRYTNIAHHVNSAIDNGVRGFDRWFGYPDKGYGYPEVDKIPIDPWTKDDKYPGDLSSIVENSPITPFIQEKREVVLRYKEETMKNAYTAAR